ncbi:MAG: superoxide dismutase, partial [Oscillospiraceae bacterium]
QCLSLEQLLAISGKLPENVGVPIARNAGGVYNHRFYFNELSPTGMRTPVGELSAAIDRCFGSFEAFRKAFSAAAMSVFGSGYAWLVADRCGRLRIITTANQETPPLNLLRPILNIDVWEHAYYLKHYNLRGDYIEDWFNVVDWFVANDRYMS